MDKTIILLDLDRMQQFCLNHSFEALKDAVFYGAFNNIALQVVHPDNDIKAHPFFDKAFDVFKSIFI
jgi:hypothetical protein